MSYEQKYLKYKKKYIELKNLQNVLRENNLKGGYSNTEIDRSQKIISDININNKDEIYLSSTYNPLKSQINKYFDLLDKLLVKTDNMIINMDFINNFNRNIYYDSDNSFSINVDTNNFNNQSIYKIDRLLTSTTNCKIFKLSKTSQLENHRGLLDNLVLKQYFDNIDNYDYLSLEIGRVVKSRKPTDVLTFENNYYKITEEEFNKFNFNDINLKDLLKTNTDDNIFDDEHFDRLYISCKNINAINDFIINLILQKITIDNNFPKNFVKYHNLYITKLSDGKESYCLLMEQIDGTIKNLYDQINTYYAEISILFRYITIVILSEINILLECLKQKEFLFNHTDLKLENVFFKKEQINNDELLESLNNPDNHNIIYSKESKDRLKQFKIVYNNDKYTLYEINNNNLFKYIFLLADFDKSQITYKNIRFYNKESKIDSQSFMKVLLQSSKLLNSSKFVENINNEEIQKLFNRQEFEEKFYDAQEGTKAPKTTETLEDTEDIYTHSSKFKKEYNLIRLSFIKRISELTGINVETEQLILRYNMFPYYTSYDIQTFILSLFTLKKFEFTNENACDKLLSNIFKEYFADWSLLYNIYKDYDWSQLTSKDQKFLYLQNFGYLIKPLMDNESSNISLYNISIFNRADISPLKLSYVNKLYISPFYKLCLSIPICYNKLYTQLTLKQKIKTLTSSIKTFSINPRNTLSEIQELIPLYRTFNIESLDKNRNLFDIYYTGDTDETNKWIIKTNRYSHFRYLYEYDNIKLDDIVKLIIEKFFN